MNKSEAERHRLNGIQHSKNLGIYKRSKLKFTKYNKNLQNAFYEYFHRKYNHMSMQEIADTNNMSRSTLYKKLNKYHPSRYSNHFRIKHCTRSFSDWIGGKARPSILSKLQALLPVNYDPKSNRFYELFSGMASLSFSIQPNNLVLNDTNKAIIDAFQCVKDHPKELIQQLHYRISNNSKAYYYHTRDAFNRGINNVVDRTSALLYIIASSFNSFIRYNANGNLNMAYGDGHCKHIAPEVIMNDSTYLKSIHLKLLNMDFEDAIKKYPPSPHDFIYLDPPYAKGFQSYGAKTFTNQDLIRLKNLCLKLTYDHVYIMVSNYDTPLVRKIFTKFKIYPFKNADAINSNGKARKKKFREIIITNY